MEHRHDEEQSLACRVLEAHVDRVGVRLPEFSAADPEAWFLIMENNFRAAGVVADSTKYTYVVSAVALRHIDQLRDILTNPPTEHQYVFLKAEVISRRGSTKGACSSRARRWATTAGHHTSYAGCATSQATWLTRSCCGPSGWAGCPHPYGCSWRTELPPRPAG